MAVLWDAIWGSFASGSVASSLHPDWGLRMGRFGGVLGHDTARTGPTGQTTPRHAPTGPGTLARGTCAPDRNAIRSLRYTPALPVADEGPAPSTVPLALLRVVGRGRGSPTQCPRSWASRLRLFSRPTPIGRRKGMPGFTPLAVAACCGHQEIVGYLVQVPSHQPPWGRTCCQSTRAGTLRPDAEPEGLRPAAPHGGVQAKGCWWSVGHPSSERLAACPPKCANTTRGHWGRWAATEMGSLQGR